MSFKKYYLISFIYILAISALGSITIWSFFQEDLVLSRYILAVAWICLIYFFVRFFKRSTKIIDNLIETMQGDGLIFIPETSNVFGKDFSKLISFLNNKIETVKIEKEEQFHFFKTAVDQSGSGIIVYDKNGKVRLTNKAILKIFRINTLSDIHQLSNNNPDIYNKLINTTENSFILGVKVQNELFKISFKINDFIVRGENLKVASLQNVSSELDREELDAWKKLMHVITHEIMNSVTPMKTLAYSLLNIYDNNGNPIDLKEIESNDIIDTHQGLQAIDNRVKGLMKFVESYRTLYKIPEPQFINFPINDVINEIKQLYSKECLAKNIKIIVEGDESVKLFADKEMITQLLINLTKNAMDALDKIDKGTITISWNRINKGVELKIKDNGIGMSESTINEIFVPFYTTKEQGSGIGLYYSKMIVFLHKGSIRVNSQSGKGSEFTLKF